MASQVSVQSTPKCPGCNQFYGTEASEWYCSTCFPDHRPELWRQQRQDRVAAALERDRVQQEQRLALETLQRPQRAWEVQFLQACRELNRDSLSTLLLDLQAAEANLDGNSTTLGSTHVPALRQYIQTGFTESFSGNDPLNQLFLELGIEFYDPRALIPRFVSRDSNLRQLPIFSKMLEVPSLRKAIHRDDLLEVIYSRDAVPWLDLITSPLVYQEGNLTITDKVMKYARYRGSRNNGGPTPTTRAIVALLERRNKEINAWRRKRPRPEDAEEEEPNEDAKRAAQGTDEVTTATTPTCGKRQTLDFSGIWHEGSSSRLELWGCGLMVGEEFEGHPHHLELDFSFLTEQ